MVYGEYGPGNLMSLAGPYDFRRFSKIAAWVDFPERSSPSMTINAPRFSFGSSLGRGDASRGELDMGFADDLDLGWRWRWWLRSKWQHVDSRRVS